MTIVGTTVAVALIVTIVVFVIGDDSTDSAASGPTAPASVACVGLKDPLPTGAPKVTIPAGPAPIELETDDLVVGKGAVVTADDEEIEVNYLGVTCRTGKIFDSSWSRNATLKASLAGGLIDGWREGIPGMREGGRRILRIPPELAYGQSGGPGIPPNEPLIFVVDLVKA